MSTSVLLGTAWGALAGVWLWDRAASGSAVSRRPLPASRARPAPTGTRGWSAAARSGLVAGCTAILTALGRPVRRRALRDAHPEADPAVGAGVLAGLGIAVLVHPLPGLAPVAAALAWPPVSARRAARQRAAAVVDQLPDLIDLLRLTTLAGLPVGAAITAIGSRPGGATAHSLNQAAQLLRRGASTSAALETLASHGGPPIRPLVDALVDHDRYGTPLGPALDRVGIESRMRRRRQAEEAARRLPVTLLFPLVLTTLPACVLLTVVPLVVSSLSAIRP